MFNNSAPMMIDKGNSTNQKNIQADLVASTDISMQYWFLISVKRSYKTGKVFSDTSYGK